MVGPGLRKFGPCSRAAQFRRRTSQPATPRGIDRSAASTRRSGKLHSATFRFACDKKLRNAIVNFADDSRHASPWAADIYNRARARNLRHPHAVRVLARAWIRVIWRCWQDGVAYDPDKHGGHQRLLMTAAA